MKTDVLAYHNIGCVGIEALLELGIEITAVFTRKDDPSEAVEKTLDFFIQEAVGK